MGEGFLNCEDSHFERFRRVYRGTRLPRRFPGVFSALVLRAEGSGRGLHALWRALGFYSAAFDGLEPGGADGTGGGAEGSRSAPSREARLLAALLDVRYQLLLVRLYQIYGTDPGAEAELAMARRIRIDCALREMRFVIAPLMDCIRQVAAASGGCPALYNLPPYFDPHMRDEQQRIQADRLSDTKRLVDDLCDAAHSSGGIGCAAVGTVQSVTAVISDLEVALATLEVGHE
jgi:hypothetical protein